MTNYKVIIEYVGTAFKGWQKQGNTDNTIQGKIERCLSEIAGEAVEIHGAGRTDAGVHAKGQVANFHCKSAMPCEQMLQQLRTYLPEDIGILRCKDVSERFHARLNASEKTYLYRVMCSDVPHIFDRRYVYVMPKALDIKAMEQAAKLLKGTHDFKGFSTKKKMKKNLLFPLKIYNLVLPN